MVAGGAIFALYEVSTALSVREKKRLEAAGGVPVTKIATKVSVLLLSIFQVKKKITICIYTYLV